MAGSKKPKKLCGLFLQTRWSIWLVEEFLEIKRTNDDSREEKMGVGGEFSVIYYLWLIYLTVRIICNVCKFHLRKLFSQIIFYPNQKSNQTWDRGTSIKWNEYLEWLVLENNIKPLKIRLLGLFSTRIIEIDLWLFQFRNMYVYIWM